MKKLLPYVCIFLVVPLLPAQAQVRPPLVTIQAVDRVASESGDTASFIVRRSRASQKGLRVFYRIAGNARSGADFRRLRGSVVIPPGSFEAPIQVMPIDDRREEQTERVVLSLKPPPNNQYRLGSVTRQAVQIADNDPPGPTFEIALWREPVRGDPLYAQRPYYAPAFVQIAAHVDPWAVQSIEFFNGNQSIGTLPNPDPAQAARNPTDNRRPPFVFAWSNVPAGTYTISAIALGNDGRRMFAAPFTFTVQPRPTAAP